MPTYSYACKDCGYQFDIVQAFTDDSLTQCPRCQGKLRKLFNSVGVVFKGSGFYRNDSRSESSGSVPAAAGGSGDSAAAKPAAAASGGDSGSKSGGKSADKKAPSGPSPAPAKPSGSSGPSGSTGTGSASGA